MSHAINILKTKFYKPLPRNAPAQRKSSLESVRLQLKTLGATAYNLALPETHALAYVVHPDETIQGIVYGRYKEDSGLVGRGALVATNERLFLLDKKPLSIRSDEIIYDAVSGITFSRVGILGIVILHTKQGDIKVRTLNRRCAKSFIEAVEANIFNTLQAQP